MMIAVPLFETEVAPRFCFAREILVVSVEAGEVVSRERVFAEPMTWPERIRLLERMGVELILAGGFNRCQIPMASAHGIRVVCGLRGGVEEVLEAYCRGELEQGETLTPPRSPERSESPKDPARRTRKTFQRRQR
jgi:predicted Fe-Mo cluster-binding NifX family protein